MNNNIQIETGKELKLDNVASFRKKMKQTDVQQEVQRFVNILKDSETQKKGPMISATFGLEQVNGEQVLDMEFMVPIDRKVDLPEGYKVKPIFHLMHALYTRYIGKPELIQHTYKELMDCLSDKKLQQITVAYNVNINDDKVSQGEEPIIDIYIGVNPNIC